VTLIDRRQFLHRSGLGLLGAGAVAVGGSSLLAACGSSSSSSKDGGSLTALTLQTSWVADAEFSGYFIADTKGYYHQHQINITITPGGPNVTPEQVVASGRAQVGLSSADTITAAKNNGAPLMIIGTQYQKNPLGILSLKKSNINTPRDLVGKTLGVPPGSTDQITAFLTVNHIDPKSVNTVSYGSDPTPIANGSVDAAVAFVTTDPFLLQEKGFETSTFLLADYNYNIYNDCVFVTQDTLKNQRPNLVSFLRASILGWQDNLADPKYVVPLITDNYGKSLGLSPQSQQAQNDAQIPLLQSPATQAHGLFWMDDAGIQVNMDTLTATHFSPDKSIFDVSVLQEVYSGANHL
jgi:ABC-type nitrate/sulfonate/bicarbonate transport system substrate-binding protein